MMKSMKLMKSLLNNFTYTPASHACRTLLLLLMFCMSVGSVWGQIAVLGTGAIDDAIKIEEYNEIKTDYPVNVSTLLPPLASWTGGMVENTTGGQHWNGTSDSYWEQTGGDWASSSWTKSMSITVHLPKGKYMLIGACRSSQDAAAYISVNGSKVYAPKGDTGLGITTDGRPSFEPSNTYANSNNGRGWQYRYIKFDVTDDNGYDIPIEIGGSTDGHANQWMSFTQPQLFAESTANNGAFETGTAYTFKLYNSTDYYLNMTDGAAVITGSAQQLYLIQNSDGKYFITDGTHYLGTSNNVNLTTTVAGRTAASLNEMSWVNTQYTGYYTISYQTDNYVGVEYPGYNVTCYANRPQSGGDNNLWGIFKSFILTDLTQEMYKAWSGNDANATPTGNTGCAYGFGISTGDVYGDMGVADNHYADLSKYGKLELTVTDGAPRLVFNRIGSTSDYDLEIDHDSGQDYVTINGNKWTIDLEKIVREKGYAHLNCIKGANWVNVTITAATLTVPLEGDSFSNLYHQWNGTGAGATITVQKPANFVWRIGEEIVNGGVIYGESSGSVPNNQYADLSSYDKLVITYDNTKQIPRFIFNNGTGQNIIVSGNENPSYMSCDGNTIIVDLARIRQEKGFAHLNNIKAAWGDTPTVLYDVYFYVGNFTVATNVPNKVEKTFKLSEDEWLHGSREFTVHFNFDEWKLYLYDSNGHPVAGQALQPNDGTGPDGYWWQYDKFNGHTLHDGAISNFYVRWYLKDKSTGNVKNIPNSLINGIYKQTVTHQDGVAWSMKLGDGMRNLHEILKLKIDGTPELGQPFDLRNYDLVCAISEQGNETLTDGQFTADASPINIEYTFHFETNSSFVHYGGAYGDGERPLKDGRQDVHTVEYDIYVKEGGMVLLELPFQDAWSSSANVYPGNSNEPREYFRWYDWATDYAVTGNAGRLEPLHAEATVYNDGVTPYYALLKDRFVEGGQSRGLMAWFPDRVGYNEYGVFAGDNSWRSAYFVPPHKSTTAVTKFFRPVDAGWTQTDVACDVSRYRDGINTTTYELEHEPTLSVRYIWHIHPAEELAEKIKTSLKVEADGIHPLEDGGTLQLGLNYDGQAMANLHTGLQDIDDYYFYEYNEAANTWGNEMYRAENLMWRVYTPDGQYYHDFWANDIQYWDIQKEWGTNNITSEELKIQTNRKVYTDADFSSDAAETETKELASRHTEGMYTRFFKFVFGTYSAAAEEKFKLRMNPSVYWLNEYDFTPVAGGATIRYNFQNGETVPIIAYVTTNDKSKMAPVLRTDMLLKEGYHPILYSQIDTPPADKEELYKERNRLWLETNMKHAGTITFDPPTGETKMGFTEVSLTDGNFNAPTNPVDNMYDKGLIPEAGRYGYCYPQLRKESQVFTYAGITPFHGEYGLFKAKSGTSFDPDENSSSQHIVGEGTSYETYYCWYTGGTLRDRTNILTNGAKHGYFLYVDASDESRAITSIPFEATLCGGASIVVTAAVANMTPHNYLNDADKLAASPQILFKLYAIDDKTNEKVLLESFTSGDFNSVGADQSVQWYQIYAKAELDRDVSEKYSRYELEVNNYCDNTDGADYAIDDVRVYTSTAKLLAVVTNDACEGGDNTRLKIVINADDVLHLLGNPTSTPGKNLFYRIFKRADDDFHTIREIDALKGTNFYPNEGGENGDYYGVVPFNYDSSNDYSSSLAPGVKTGFYKDGETLYFQITEDEFLLPAGQKYFVSVYSVRAPRPGHTDAENEELHGWGCPYLGNECSIYSNDFMPRKMFIELKENGTYTDGRISISCQSTFEPNHNYDLILKIPTVYGGFDEYSSITYDFFVGEDKSEYTSDVVNALNALRFVSNVTYNTSNIGDLPNDLTPAQKTLLTDLVNQGKLLLANSTQFNLSIQTSDLGKTKTVICEPVQTTTSDSKDICSSLVIQFVIDKRGELPLLKIGFDDVEYPDDYEQVVRVGLEQLDKMMNSGYKLHIPLSDYHDKAKGTTNIVEFEENQLVICKTNDPTFPIDGDGTLTTTVKFASVINPEGSGDVFVNNTQMFLALDLSTFPKTTYQLHEGYYYEVAGQYYDHEQVGYPDCRQDLFFIVKVVPKYVTWKSNKIVEEDIYFNANWCYDENWERSEKAELYKSDYQNNNEIDAKLTTHPGFVPMKFTYVTMLSENHAPDLNNLERNMVAGTPQQGGSLIYPNNTMLTNTSPTNDNHTYSSYSTSDIKYDMMVRYGTDADGEGCKGHYQKDNRTTWNRMSYYQPTADKVHVFDVEKYMGNVCKEIYFKPGAELLQQQRLRYEKAWVEKELVANRWYLMSTPLKDTYAGDMYVPYSATASDNGRQLTEAFQPITFNTTTYSRTKYPIYQHSWGQTAKVYTKTDDVRATDYSAKISFGSVTSNLIEWSHTYNDVQVPYNSYTGFAIRAHKKVMQDGSNNDIPALIRLPKEDTSYDFYQWDNQTPASGAVTAQTVTKGATGQFVMDRYSQDLDKVEIPRTNLQAQGTDEDGYTYYLVGNPFMGSIDMGKFFGYYDTENGVYNSYNLNLEKVYYVYDKDTGALTPVNAATTAGLIKPLEAFIVKCRDADAPDNIVFDRNMLIDGNYTPATLYAPEPDPLDTGGDPSPARGIVFALKASNGRNSSSANVEIREQSLEDYDVSEDVKTLFDSNLSDVPMVYTVAGGQAVSIDVRPEMSVVPFGVVCTDTEEPVTVTLEGTGITDSQLYVLDAMTGEQTAVEEGVAFTIVPNDYGRYFLTSSCLQENMAKDQHDGLIIRVRNGVVTVTAHDELGTVRAVRLSGQTAYSQTGCGQRAEFSLQPGVYIIEATGATNNRNMKIIVK